MKGRAAIAAATDGASAESRKIMHGCALIRAEVTSAHRHERVLAKAQADHKAAVGRVLCAQAVGRAAVVSRSGWQGSLGAW